MLFAESRSSNYLPFSRISKLGNNQSSVVMSDMCVMKQAPVYSAVRWEKKVRSLFTLESLFTLSHSLNLYLSTSNAFATSHYPYSHLTILSQFEDLIFRNSTKLSTPVGLKVRASTVPTQVEFPASRTCVGPD